MRRRRPGGRATTADYDGYEERGGGESESEEEGVIAQFVAGDEAAQLIDETHRLAVVDLEWERIRAVDILAVRG
jgi:hypothetical protein